MFCIVSSPVPLLPKKFIEKVRKKQNLYSRFSITVGALVSSDETRTRDFESSAMGSLSQAVEFPILLTVVPYSLHLASSKIEAKVLLSQSSFRYHKSLPSFDHIG